jgi:hypothetical protein
MDESIKLVNTATEETAPRLTRVNVVCSSEMLDWLDSVSNSMYRKTGVRVSRSEVLRGLCEGFADHKPQFTGCHSGADIRRVIGRLFDVYAKAKANSLAPRLLPKATPEQGSGVSAGSPAKTACSDLDEYLEARANLKNTRLPLSATGRSQ